MPRTPLPPAIAQRLLEATLSAPKTDSYGRQEFSNVYLQTKEFLIGLFGEKCAFCESILGRQESNVHHFRPKGGVVGLGGDSREHYGWLAYEWTNLHLACRVCAANQRNQFPVDGPRASPGTGPADLPVEEKALLLDPCRDQPEEHLRFEDGGEVIGLTRQGEATIETFGLNRPSLLKQRGTTIKMIVSLLHSSAPELPSILRSAIAASAAYAGAVRQCIFRRVTEGQAFGLNSEDLSLLGAHPQSVRPEIPIESIHTKTSYIQSVKIENFRALRKLSLKFPAPSGDAAPWTMLLGENGAGKSSVLEALALALLGAPGLEKLQAELGHDLSQFITNGESVARITITMSAAPGTISLTLRRDRKSKFTRGEAGSPGILMGFGAVRLSGHSERPAGPVTNLFRSLTPLPDSKRWITDLPDSRFTLAAATLHDLLQMTGRVTRNNELVSVEVPSGPSVSFDQLSTGYRSVLALGCEIMRRAPDTLADFRLLSGILLVDELDAHLHPRWKMQIVQAFRTAFPGIQFVASTHEPLCLRGLQPDETVLMHQGPEGRSVVTNLPPTHDLRVDQLLTSRLFGLSSTLDPKVEQSFRLYYQLLARKSELSSEERKQFEELRIRVNREGQLGYTRRDQLVYELIDEYLSREPVGKPAERLLRKTRKKVFEVWDRLDVPQ